MNPEIIAAWIGIGGAVIVGAIGWVFAGFANGRAKQANALAKTANRLAAEAVDAAKKSNRIAKDANRLSEKTYTLVQTEAAQKTEQWLVEWQASWDADTAILFIKNLGRDTALRPTVSFKGKTYNSLRDGLDDVPGGEQIEIPLPQIAERRKRFNAERAARLEQMRSKGIFGVNAPFRTGLKITIHWFTKAGTPQTHEVDIVLR